MFRRFSVNFALFAMAMDAALVAGNLFIVSLIRPALSNLSFAAYIPYPLNLPWVIYPLFAIVWVGTLAILSVYDGQRYRRVSDEISSLTLGSALAAGVLAGTLYMSYREVSRLLFVLFVILTYVSLAFWRYLAHRLKNDTKHNQQRRKVLIAGAGSIGRQLALQIQQDVHPLAIAGFLDDDAQKQVTHPDILGEVAAARQTITNLQVDDVIIALPHSAYEKINQLVAELHNLPVNVWIIPDYFRMALHRAKIEDFAGIPLLDLRAPAINEYQRMLKRAFDLFVSLPSLLLLSPVMGLVALAIRLDSHGPAIFKQQRVGENGRLFTMYKFRTMVHDAEQRNGEVEQLDDQGRLIHKIPDDPRVTRVGRFLRRTSLDELPQLWNVVRGEMSMVGPRPELPRLVDCYEPWQRKRFTVPQGLTGWWQINGRSDRPMHLHTEDDLYYVQHYSIFLDIKILLKTVWTALRGKGAF